MGRAKLSPLLTMGLLLAAVLASSYALGYYGRMDFLQPRHVRWHKAYMADNNDFDPYSASKSDPDYLHRLVSLLSEVGRRK